MQANMISVIPFTTKRASTLHPAIHQAYQARHTQDRKLWSEFIVCQKQRFERCITATEQAWQVVCFITWGVILGN